MISYPHFEKATGNTKARRVISLLIALAFIVLLLISSAWYVRAGQPPHAFPVGTDIVITEGMTLGEIAKHLEIVGVITSSFMFQATLANEYAGQHVQAGSYRFPMPLEVGALAKALVHGEYTSPLQKITFPEGFRIRDFDTYFPGTNLTEIDEYIQKYEGYLFPDTYFVTDDTTTAKLIESMQNTYEERLTPLREQIATSGYTEKEIITLASIIEREANSETSMRMVSGVLHNRLSIDMALQVDAVFEYAIGRGSAELTESDLLLDSPYNTYTRAGFPPTPIGNPGMVAILAALNPIQHNYLYYLTGTDGEFYYAETFDRHRQNKARYLR